MTDDTTHSTGDAPERIWAWPWTTTNAQGQWSTMDVATPATEFVRADLAAPRWHRIDDPDNPPPKGAMSIMLYIPSKAFSIKQGFWDKDHFRWYGCPTVKVAKRHQPTHWKPLDPPPEDE